MHGAGEGREFPNRGKPGATCLECLASSRGGKLGSAGHWGVTTADAGSPGEELAVLRLLVSKRTLSGWRPTEVEWPEGQWSFPGNPGVMTLFSRPRREEVRGYD